MHERPPGTPKPIIEENIGPLLKRLDAWYAANLPSGDYHFDRPAKNTEIGRLQSEIGISLPRSFKQLYQWHNGEVGRLSHFFGYQFYPLSEVLSQWSSWRASLNDYFKGDRYAIRGGAWPRDAVDSAYINTKWIPLFGDGGGDHIGLDFDPWPKGRIGQVIIFGRDEDVKCVVAESLGQFLRLIVGQMENGNFVFQEDDGHLTPNFYFRHPPRAQLSNGLRVLLGAPSSFL